MARLCPEGHKHDGMIAETLSNSGKLVDLGNASSSELVRRPNSRQQQGMGGADGTVAQDNFIGLDNEGLSPGINLHSGGPLAVEQYAADHAVAPDGQVQTVPGKAEVAQRGTEANAVGVVQGYRSNAGGVGVVHVRHVGHSDAPACLVEGRLIGAPLRPVEAPAYYRAVRIVEIAAPELGVGFHLPKVLQQVLVTPLVVTLSGPRIVVLGHAPEEHLAVDGTAATGNLAPGDLQPAAGVGASPVEIPVVMRCDNVDSRGEAKLDFIGQILEIRVVRSGLQQQHRPVRVFTQTGGYHATPRARSDYDGVIPHVASTISIE